MGGVMLSKNEQFRLRIIEDFLAKKISRERAAEILDVDERTVSRLAARIREKGAPGIKHGNSGRAPRNKASEEKTDHIGELFKDFYFDFNITHCRDMLIERENIAISYTSLRRIAHKVGAVKRKHRRRSKKRTYRERMVCEGLMWQMDGSHHKWNGKDEWCLIGIIDDATSTLAGAQFYGGEDTVNCMELMEGAIGLHGIPECVYVDKAGWFGGTKRQGFSQFERACEELDIRVLYANSPEAKGRIERAWSTFQDRLIPELRLHGITSMIDANRYLMQVFLPLYWNQKLRVEAANQKNRYRPLKAWHDLPQIFCIKNKRWVKRDHTIEFRGRKYRIETIQGENLSNRQIEIREYRDGSWGAFCGRTPLTLKLIEPQRRRWVS